MRRWKPLSLRRSRYSAPNRLIPQIRVVSDRFQRIPPRELAAVGLRTVGARVRDPPASPQRLRNAEKDRAALVQPRPGRHEQRWFSRTPDERPPHPSGPERRGQGQDRYRKQVIASSLRDDELTDTGEPAAGGSWLSPCHLFPNIPALVVFVLAGLGHARFVYTQLFTQHLRL